jgi:hypothetical protein
MNIEALDDRLPVSADGKLKCSSTLMRDQLWPSLLEKAVSALFFLFLFGHPVFTNLWYQYMKWTGGYDFRGSLVARLFWMREIYVLILDLKATRVSTYCEFYYYWRFMVTDFFSNLACSQVGCQSTYFFIREKIRTSRNTCR